MLINDNQAEINKLNRKAMWLEDLDKYCTRHGITRRQYCSIFSESSDNNWKSLIWPSGEPFDWMYQVLKDENENPS